MCVSEHGTIRIFMLQKETNISERQNAAIEFTLVNWNQLQFKED